MRRRTGFKVNAYGSGWFNCYKCCKSVKYRSGALWEMVSDTLEPHNCRPDVTKMRRVDIDPDVIAQYEREANKKD